VRLICLMSRLKILGRRFCSGVCVIVIGVRTYLCHCAQPIPQDPFCGDRGVEDDE
jgi:hypothetical protein